MDNNIMFWHAVIFGPEDTPWEGGEFEAVSRALCDTAEGGPDGALAVSSQAPSS